LTGELCDLMGLPPDMTIEVSTEEIPGAAADATNDVVSEAMANNVELKQAQTELRAREFKLKGEEGGRWPSFALTGQYNVLSKINNYTDFFGKFQRKQTSFWRAKCKYQSLHRAQLPRSLLRARISTPPIWRCRRSAMNFLWMFDASQIGSRGRAGRRGGAAGVAARAGKRARLAGPVLTRGAAA